MTSIAILLATYNGGHYLLPLLDSIAAQTVSEWHLYAHDDGSTDDTVAQLRLFADKHPGKVSILSYPSTGGAYANFMSLLRRTEADYYMFADQDDVWHPNKIALSLAAMREAEQQHTGKPIVVHTDLRVVDDSGQTIAPSFWQMAGIHPEMFRSFEERITNVVTGCTMLFNATARQTALQKKPLGKPLHDEWVTIRTCAEDGVVVTLREQTIDYRQHSNNTLGAEACVQKKGAAYYITHIAEAVASNKQNYEVLRSAGYGSKLTYMKNKLRNFALYHLKY